MSRRPLQGLAELARDRGARGIWFAALGKLGYRRMLVRECPLDSRIPDITPRVALTFDQLQPDQLRAYHAFRSAENPDLAERRLAEDHCCFVARHRGDIVCVCWGATGRAWSAYLSLPIAMSRSLDFHNIGRVGRIRIAGFQYDFVRMAPGALAPGKAPHER